VSPASRTADSMWTRFGQNLAGSPPVLWVHHSVLRHPTLTRCRTATKETWARVADVGYPLIVLGRGVRRGAASAGSWWKAASREKKQLHTVVALVCVIGVGLLRMGPLLLIGGFLGGAAWLGRDVSKKGADLESAGHISRLQAVYNGLVPYLQNGDDPDQHFKPGGYYRDAFTAWEFDDADRLIRLRFDYSEYFRDGEADSRAKVERALEGKVGQANEYLYSWDEEGNHLDVRVLPPLETGIAAQRWPVADIEFVLGFTDPGSASRQIPVLVPDPNAAEITLTPQGVDGRVPPGYRVVRLAPVIWRVSSPNTDPHLLVLGGPFAGKSTTVRSLIAQALAHGHQVAVVDMDQSAEYSGLSGTPGVLRVAENAADSLDLLDWLGLEIERRAIIVASAAADAPDGAVEPGGDAVAATPPLWLFVDDLPELADAAARTGRPDPQDLLAVLARKARFAHTTLVVTARSDRASALRPALRNQLTSRIVLGKVDPALSTALFGGTLELGGGLVMPPGRGYVRIGTGPVIRLQAPYAPSLVLSGV
jgi:hypothetical protein